MTKPPDKPRKKPGPPSTYTDAIGEEICFRVAVGESLKKICATPGMPTERRVMRWLANNAKLASEYARAREQQADAMDALIMEVAEASTPETAAADRIKIDAFRWRASKLKPKVYGDKLDVAVSHTLDLTNALDEARGRLANAAPALLDVTPNALPNTAPTGDNDA